MPFESFADRAPWLAKLEELTYRHATSLAGNGQNLPVFGATLVLVAGSLVLREGLPNERSPLDALDALRIASPEHRSLMHEVSASSVAVVLIALLMPALLLLLALGFEHVCFARLANNEISKNNANRQHQQSRRQPQTQRGRRNNNAT